MKKVLSMIVVFTVMLYMLLLCNIEGTNSVYGNKYNRSQGTVDEVNVKEANEIKNVIEALNVIQDSRRSEI
ncbi:MAG: hypothetical protein ABRQ27_03555 [Clostridiaceae bacterium]